MESDTATTTEGRSKTAGAAVTPSELTDLSFAAAGLGLTLSESLREYSINDLLKKAVEFRRRLAA